MNKPQIARRLCRNPYCLEEVAGGWALCPSCRYIGRMCFWLGSLLAGVLVEAAHLILTKK